MSDYVEKTCGVCGHDFRGDKHDGEDVCGNCRFYGLNSNSPGWVRLLSSIDQHLSAIQRDQDNMWTELANKE